MERLDNWMTTSPCPSCWLADFQHFASFALAISQVGFSFGQCECQTSGYCLLPLVCFSHEEGSMQRTTRAPPHHETQHHRDAVSIIRSIHSMLSSVIETEELPYSVAVFFCKRHCEISFQLENKWTELMAFQTWFVLVCPLPRSPPPPLPCPLRFLVTWSINPPPFPFHGSLSGFLISGHNRSHINTFMNIRTQACMWSKNMCYL